MEGILKIVKTEKVIKIIKKEGNLWRGLFAVNIIRVFKAYILIFINIKCSLNSQDSFSTN